jgi:hypothetical protein
MFKKKILISIIIISLLINIPFSYCPTDEGYGEDNDNLGQFVDSYENDDNITVAYQVINNVTLDCMELEETAISEVIYNLTSLREHDRYGGAQTVIVTFSIANNDELRMTDAGLGRAYIFLIVDSSWLDDKYVRFRYYPYSSVVNPIYQTQRFEVHDGTYDRSNNTDFPSGSLPPNKGNGKLYDYVNVDGLNNWYVKDFQINTSGGSETNVTVWWVNADAWGGTAIGLYLDWIEINDSAGGNDNLITINYNNSSPITMEQVGTEGDYGYALSPELPLESGGFASDGYFMTEDYLNYTTGNSLTLLTNASIPDSTTLTVQFSNDNSTWVDNEGNVGSTSLIAGFQAIDLRDLNYTDIYSMYNFTGLLASTPRLYQSRLITTLGGNATSTTTESEDYAGLIIIGLIIGIVLGIGLGRQ